jgi:hypothetical protein
MKIISELPDGIIIQQGNRGRRGTISNYDAFYPDSFSYNIFPRYSYNNVIYPDSLKFINFKEDNWSNNDLPTKIYIVNENRVLTALSRRGNYAILSHTKEEEGDHDRSLGKAKRVCNILKIRLFMNR